MIQAHYPKLKPQVCNMFDQQSHCETVGGGNAALLYVALYILAIGSAGIKAALPSHGADQFDEKDPKEAMQMSSFFNHLLLGVCVGGAASLTLIVWIQDYKGWDWGLGISSAAIFFMIIIFTAGLPLYRVHIVSGSSAIVQILQVCSYLQENKKEFNANIFLLLTSVQMNVLFRYMLHPFVIESLCFLKTLQISLRLKWTRRLL